VVNAVLLWPLPYRDPGGLYCFSKRRSPLSSTSFMWGYRKVIEDGTRGTDAADLIFRQGKTGAWRKPNPLPRK
jgi:hypothetical protein